MRGNSYIADDSRQNGEQMVSTCRCINCCSNRSCSSTSYWSFAVILTQFDAFPFYAKNRVPLGCKAFANKSNGAILDFSMLLYSKNGQIELFTVFPRQLPTSCRFHCSPLSMSNLKRETDDASQEEAPSFSLEAILAALNLLTEQQEGRCLMLDVCRCNCSDSFNLAQRRVAASEGEYSAKLFSVI